MTQQKTVLDAISEEKVKIKKQLAVREQELNTFMDGMKILQPLIEIFDQFDPEDFVKYVKNIRENIKEIPMTESFKKKFVDLMKKMAEENEMKIYIRELLELSHEAFSGDKAEAKKKYETKKTQDRKTS